MTAETRTEEATETLNEPIIEKNRRIREPFEVNWRNSSYPLLFIEIERNYESINEFTKKNGLAPARVYRVLAGEMKPSIKFKVKMAKIFGVDSAILFKRNPKEEY